MRSTATWSRRRSRGSAEPGRTGSGASTAGGCGRARRSRSGRAAGSSVTSGSWARYGRGESRARPKRGSRASGQPSCRRLRMRIRPPSRWRRSKPGSASSSGTSSPTRSCVKSSSRSPAAGPRPFAGGCWPSPQGSGSSIHEEAVGAHEAGTYDAGPGPWTVPIAHRQSAVPSSRMRRTRAARTASHWAPISSPRS